MRDKINRNINKFLNYIRERFYYDNFELDLDLILSHHKEEKREKCFCVPIFNRKMYLCARCSSIIIGMFIFAISHHILLSHQLSFTLIEKLLISFILVIPMGIDGGLQYLGIKKSSKFRRISTGLLFGAGVVFLGIYLSPILKVILFFIFFVILLIMIYFLDPTKKLIKKETKGDICEPRI